MPEVNEVFGGYGEDGIPRWLLRDLKYYRTFHKTASRVRRRLIRMLKILKARSPWYDGNNEYNDSVQRERLREDRKELWMMRLWMQKAQAENLALAVRSRNQQSALDQANKERDHWKANHANMVAINRALRERPDMGDRARAVQALQDTIEELRNGDRIQAMKREIDELRAMLWKREPPVNLQPGSST